jgi:hypothetical protein
MPNYGKRYRSGIRISTGFVESSVNEIIAKRMAKRQQMRWNKPELPGSSHSRPQRHFGRRFSQLASRLSPYYRARCCRMSAPQLCMLSFSARIAVPT